MKTQILFCQSARAGLALVLVSFAVASAEAATVLWSSSGGSAWLTGNNWTGSSVPTSNDVAQFGANPTGAGGVGINFNSATTPGPLNQAVGAMEQTSARTSGALVVGNSTSVAGKDGTLTLNGATVNSAANVVLRNASSRDVTLQESNGGSRIMIVALANSTENLIVVDGSGNIVISTSLHSSNSPTPLTLTGAGSGRVDITSAANTFTGDIKVTGAEVRFTAAGSLGNAANPITIDGGRLGIVSGGTADLSARSIFLGAAAGSAITVPGSSVLTYNGVLTNKSGATGMLVKQGAGTLSLGGSNAYSGDTVINNGTMQLTTGNNRLPTGTTLSLGQAASTNLGTFDLNGRHQEIAGLNSVAGSSASATLRNTVTNSGSPATLTLSGGGTYSYGDGTTNNSGFIAGTISLMKTGGGTQTLGDTNSYTGITIVSQGVLALANKGSIPNSPMIEIAGGATFDISGLATPLTLAGGQGISASGSASPGTIATAFGKGLTTAANSALQFTAFNGTTPPLTLSGPGTLALQGGNSVTVTVVNAGSPLAVGDYKLIAKGASGTVSGTPAFITVNGDGAAGTASLVISNGELYLDVQTACPPPAANTPVPSPGATVCAGTAVTLTETASDGSTPYRYQWTSNGVNILGVNSSTLNVPAPIHGDSYVCLVSSSCGAASASPALMLTVNPAPGSTITAPSLVCPNSTNHAASVPDAGGGPTYAWAITGGTITSGATTHSIIFTAGASGTVALQCTVTSGAGCSSVGSAIVTISSPPTASTPAGATNSVGGTVTFSTTASGAAPFTYQWQVSADGGANFNNVTTGSGGTGASYTTAPLVITDSGAKYRCVVNDSCSSVTSAAATLTIRPPFTTLNLAVIRIGDGAQTLSSTGAPVFLDEYTAAGILVQSIAVPANGSSALAMSGSATSDGGLMRSPDGTTLCFAAYNTNVGTTPVISSGITRGVGTINAGGGFALALTTTAQYGGANTFRSAATDGTNNFWGAGQISGTYYFGFAASAATIQSAIANSREVNIVNGRLCFSTASGTEGIYGFAANLPTASSATNLLFATGNNSSPFAFAINPASTIAYVADDRATNSGGGIQKWTNNAGTWTLAYTITNTGAGGTGTRGLTVDWSGANPVLYATTAETANRLIKLTDTGAAATVITLATNTANKVFRGVAFAPLSAPAIIAQPQNVLTNADANATFSITASGAATLAYQWRKGGDGIAGATNSSLTLHNVQQCDAAGYEVVVSNNYGSITSSVATVTVAGHPSPSSITPGGSDSVGTTSYCGGLNLIGGGILNFEFDDATRTAGTSPGWDLVSVSQGINVQATSGNQFTVVLASLNSGSPGNAANFNPDNAYTWQMAAAAGVTNFATSSFMINDSSFSNDLKGGAFSLETNSSGMNLKFNPNHAPVTSNTNFTRAPGLPVKIKIADLLALSTSDADGDARQLIALGPPANGGSLAQEGGVIHYTPPPGEGNDSFTYTVRDIRNYRSGDTLRTASAIISITTATPTAGDPQQIISGATATVKFAGIPGFQYNVERSTDLNSWTVLATVTAPEHGVFEFVDNDPPPGSAWYRLRPH